MVHRYVSDLVERGLSAERVGYGLFQLGHSTDKRLSLDQYANESYITANRKRCAPRLRVFVEREYAEHSARKSNWRS